MGRHIGHRSLTATSGYLSAGGCNCGLYPDGSVCIHGMAGKAIWCEHLAAHSPSEFDFVKNEVGSKSYENSWIAFDFSFSVFSNAASMSELQENGYIPLGLLLSTAFAGVHCAAWSYSFATVTEKYLWRISAILLGANAVIFVIILAILARLHENQGSSPNKLLECMLVALIYVLCGSYLLARIFLWVETFISFRSAPRGMYEAVNWTQYIGHIGS
jgi:hypothetical protein